VQQAVRARGPKMPEIRVQDRELRGEAEGRKVRQHREVLEDCAVAF